ncbi:MAG: ABC transporter ATP-binding protein [Cyanobacteriota bacterium]
METFKRILQYLFRYKSRLIIAILISFPAGGADGFIAYIIQPVLDHVLINKDQKLLFLLPIGVLVLFLITGICRYIQVYCSRYVVQGFLRDLRYDLYSKFQRIKMSYHDSNSSGALVSRLTNDTALLENISSDVLQIFLSRSISAIALTFVIFYQNWQLAILCVLVTSIIIYPISVLSKRIRRFTHEMQSSLADLTSVLTENLQGMKVIHAYNLQKSQSEKFSKENQKYFGKYMKMVQAFALLPGIMQFIGAIGIAIIIWYGGYLIISGEMTTGALISFIVAFLLLYTPVKTMGRSYADVAKALAAAERIFNIIDIDEEVIESDNPVELKEIKNCIVYENVTFKYKELDIFKNVNLKVEVGEVLAIVGSSGSGKSTMVNLLPRFYDVSSGAVKIDDQDIKDFSLESLRNKIAIVSQDTFLFDGSIKYNISIGNPDSSEDLIIKAASQAYVDNFVKNLPDGYETRVGERGVMLSGGEKQRISIARALLKDAPILILDEATSSLDNESEKIVQQALGNLIKDRTVFIIAHRLSTIKNATRIIVLDKGKIIDSGSHESLMDTCSTYKNLYELQFS